MPRPGRFAPSKELELSLQEAGWAPGQVWAGAENLSSLGSETWTFQPEASSYTY